MKPFVITELWAYVSVGPDGDEGVMACSMPINGREMMLPMVGADKTRLDKLKPYADMVSQQTDTPYVVKHFRLCES